MVTTQKNDPTGGLVRWLQLPNGRAEVSLDNIVAAVGGVIVPLGLARLFASARLGFFGATLTPGAVPLFLAAILAAVLAGIFLFVRSLSAVRPAGITAAATGVVLLAESASRLGDSPKAGLGVVLFAVLSVCLFMFPVTRHPYFLGSILYSGWRILVLLTGSGDIPITFVGAMDPRFFVNFSNVTSALSILVAGLFLGAVWLLDRSDAQGLSLPFAAVGITSAATAAAATPNLFVSVLAFVLAGAAVWVGVQLGRRGVAWAGAAGLVLSTFRLYDGFNSRFAGSVAIIVGLGLLAFAGRSLLPGVVKSMNGLASNKAVLPGGVQPGQPGPPAQSFPSAGKPPSGFGGGVTAPGFVQSAGGFAPPNGPTGFDGQAPGFSQSNQFDAPVVPEQPARDIQPPPVHEFQSPVNAEEVPSGQFLSAPFASPTNNVEHLTEEIEAATAMYQPQQARPQNEDGQVMEPNWYADPTERYDHRWHDGVNWTEHVATAGNSAVDPIS